MLAAEQGLRPELMGPAEESAAFGRIFDALLHFRLSHPADPALDVLHAAYQVSEGEAEFRRKARRDWGVAARFDPGVCGRSDGDRVATMLWFAVRAWLSEWCSEIGLLNTGRAVMDGDARGVIAFFERYYVPPKPKPGIEDEIITVTEHGHRAGIKDAFRSSGKVRTGTVREIIEDLEDPAQREREHRLVDALAARERERKQEFGSL